MSSVRKKIAAVVLSGAAAAAIVGGASLASADVGTKTLYPKCVVAQSVSLYNAPSGGSVVGSWGYRTSFQTDRKDGDRYHTWTTTGSDVWVTADHRYVQDYYEAGCWN